MKAQIQNPLTPDSVCSLTLSLSLTHTAHIVYLWSRDILSHSLSYEIPVSVRHKYVGDPKFGLGFGNQETTKYSFLTFSHGMTVKACRNAQFMRLRD
jgi:hypothetical protein